MIPTIRQEPTAGNSEGQKSIKGPWSVYSDPLSRRCVRSSAPDIERPTGPRRHGQSEVAWPNTPTDRRRMQDSGSQVSSISPRSANGHGDCLSLLNEDGRLRLADCHRGGWQPPDTLTYDSRLPKLRLLDCHGQNHPLTPSLFADLEGTDTVALFAARRQEQPRRRGHALSRTRARLTPAEYFHSLPARPKMHRDSQTPSGAADDARRCLHAVITAKTRIRNGSWFVGIRPMLLTPKPF